MTRDVTLSRMQDRTSFEDPVQLNEFLSQQLYRGQLALVLGAGASFGFGLPTWDKLISGAAERCGVNIATGISNEFAAEEVLRQCGNDEVSFAKTIHSVLYRDFDLKLSNLIRNPLLAALGALTMVSSRGSIARVISFNFDDLLEQYLSYYGFDVNSVDRMPYWASRSDVRVFHPHGMLPSARADSMDQGIVLAQIHYDKIVGKSHLAWRSVLLDILRSHTCVFIGLSGRDQNLSSLLAEATTTHAAHGEHVCWGIRYSDDAADPMRGMWEGRGVAHVTVESYGHVPDYLLAVCQGAASYVRKGRGA